MGIPVSQRAIEEARVDIGALTDARKTISNYVPDNVCVSVRSPNEIPKAADLPAVRDAAEVVRRQLNAALWHYLLTVPIPPRPEPNAGLDQWVAYDLLPVQLAAFAKAHTDPPGFEVLQTAARRTPIALDRKDGSTSLLMWYQVNRQLFAGDVGLLDPNVVRELVNATNLGLSADSKTISQPTLTATIQQAGPNWYSGGAQNTCHGPGGQPLPVNQPALPQFTFPDAPAVQTIVGTARGSALNQVVVAVLDSCPNRPDLLGHRTHLRGGGGPTPGWPEWLDGAIGEAGFTNPNWTPAGGAASRHAWIDQSDLSIPEAFIRGLLTLPNGQPIVPNIPLPLGRVFDDFYRSRDHGLFVASIVKDIASQAEVHLIRVLDDFGVGDTWLLANALNQVGQKYGNRPLIVNLSLVEDRPIGPNAYAAWFPTAFAAGLWDALLPQNLTDPTKLAPDALRLRVDSILRTLNFTVEQVIDWLNETVARVLIVAAAGNDGNFRPLIALAVRAPRSPADYHSVLAVAALKRSRDPADYTSEGDPAFELDNAVAVWGGNARITGPDLIPKIDPADPDGVIGPFSHPILSYDGGANTSGWGYWAGTSFATPVISALAACLWMVPAGTLAAPVATGADVMTYLRTTLNDPGASAPLMTTLQTTAILAQQN